MQSFKSKIQCLLLISVFLGCSFLVFGRPVLAAEVLPTPTVDPTPAEIPTPTPTPVDYYLVYPGILPDHFLYSLKMVRDRAWLILTTGAKQKAEAMLLFADKRLGAGKALIEGGKEKLGVTTITKGEKYLEQAVGQLKKAKEKEQDVSELQEKFSKAAAKHEEVLLELKEELSTEQWGVMDEMLGKVKSLREEIVELGQ